MNYISNFYAECALARKRLNAQLKKNAGPWDSTCTKAVQDIKQTVERLPILHLIREDWEKEIYTDASDIGWGAALVQICVENKEKQICTAQVGLK